MCKKFPWCGADAGLLVLRIGVGGIFIFTGWMKVSDLAGTVKFFGTLGFVPFLAYLVTFVELLGGIAVLLGIYTRIAAKLLTIVMIVAIYTLFPKWNFLQYAGSLGSILGYLRNGIQAAMTPIAVFFSTLTLVLAGGGKYSTAGKLCGCGTCAMCKEGDVKAG